MSDKRSYDEMIKLPTFKQRYEYLKLAGRVGESTFGEARHVNQSFYRSQRWRATRDKVIIRDNACDLSFDGYSINDMVIVHHMNPITLEELENDSDSLYDPRYLVCCTDATHRAIHYGDENQLVSAPVERVPGDTRLW